MGKPYSVDLRERVVAPVESGGMSCRRAAAQFGVGISTAINWVRRLRETGSVALGQMGGHKPKSNSGEYRVLGCWSGRGKETSPCADWWPNLPSAVSRLITGRCGASFTPRS